MKADLRISIKDYHRNKKLKILLFRPPFPCRGYYVRVGGKPWPKNGGPVSLARLVAALRRALVRARAGAREYGEVSGNHEGIRAGEEEDVKG